MFLFSLCLSHSRDNCCIRSCHHVYRILYICCPFTLIALQICLTSPKGLPLVLCRVQGIAITARRARLVRAHVERKTPEDPADTPHKEVAFLQQHSQWKRGGRAAASLPLAFQRMWYFGPCSSPYLPSQSHPSLICVLLSANTWYERKRNPPESDWSASLAWSLKRCPHRHQHFVYPPPVMLGLFRQEVRRHTQSTHKTRTALRGSVWVSAEEGVSESM